MKFGIFETSKKSNIFLTAAIEFEKGKTQLNLKN